MHSSVISLIVNTPANAHIPQSSQKGLIIQGLGSSKGFQAHTCKRRASAGPIAASCAAMWPCSAPTAAAAAARKAHTRRSRPFAELLRASALPACHGSWVFIHLLHHKLVIMILLLIQPASLAAKGNVSIIAAC